MSNINQSLKFFTPYSLIAVAIFAALYLTGIYQSFGVVEGYGWSNSILLNKFFASINYFPPKSSYPIIFAAFYFVISVPLQELLFRALPKMLITKKWLYVWLTSAVFALCHIYYMQLFALLMVFGMGFLTALDYWNNRNFWAICAFHALTASIAFTLNLA